MRLSLGLIVVACLVGCGNSDNGNDLGAPDMSAVADLSTAASGDMTVIAPFNMPGSVFCYTGPLCSTSSADKVCCDSKGDGGFSDSCVPSAQACLAMDAQAKTFECGQAADCTGNKLCCGTIGMSSGGKPFFTSTQCAASCATGDTQLCVTASECKTSGAKCVGQTITGRNVGLCQ
jgi:hypothetical protein